MPEPIDRLAALVEIDATIEGSLQRPEDVYIDKGLMMARTIIEKLPAIQTEHRCGEWILCKDQYNVDNDNGNYAYYCSYCKHQDVHAKTAKVSFCWNCGANMTGDSDD